MKKYFSYFGSNQTFSFFKTFLFILGSGIFLGVAAFSIHQYEMIHHQETTIQNQHNEINALRTAYSDQDYLRDELLVENEILHSTIQYLKDSIAALHIQIFNLQKVVQQQAKKIQEMEGQIDQLNAQYASLKQEIRTISHAKVIDKPKIQQLEKQKTVIREEIRDLEVAKEETVETYNSVTDELMARQVREARYLRLSSIIGNTQIKFQRIQLSEQKNDKPLQRISKNDDKWRYTTLEFYLEHEDLKLLIDERFIVKIIDADNHRVLSYIEQNPSFPASSMDTKGAGFRFDGNMIELTFYNNTEKQGKNYDLQIFYVDDSGKEYLLTNGSRPLVINRKTLNLVKS